MFKNEQVTNKTHFKSYNIVIYNNRTQYTGK